MQSTKGNQSGTHPSNKPLGKGQKGKRLRTDIQVKHDRALIMELLLKGKRLYDICEIVGIGYDLLRQDIKVIEKEMMERAVYNIDLIRQRMIEQWQLCYRLSMEAWEKSCTAQRAKHAKRHVMRGRKHKQLKLVQQDITTEQSFGDPRYMADCHRALIELSKLYGIVQVTSTSRNDEPIGPLPGSAQATFIVMPAIVAPKAPPKDITPPQIEQPR